MKTDKEIKSFMRKHAAPLPCNDGFMDELVRQIDLLPLPSAFESEAEAKRRAEKEALKNAYRSVRLRNLCRFALASVLAVGAMSAAFLLFRSRFSGIEIPRLDAECAGVADRLSAAVAGMSSFSICECCLAVAAIALVAAFVAGKKRVFLKW